MEVRPAEESPPFYHNHKDRRQEIMRDLLNGDGRPADDLSARMADNVV